MALSVLAAVRRARYAVLLFWAVLTVLGALNARRFTENTSIDLEVPPASRSYEGTQLFERAFPATSVKVGALVMRADGGPVLGDDLRALTADLGAWSAEVGIRLPSAVVGYYTLVDAKLDELASPFVSDPQDPSNSTASILVVSLPLNNSDALAVALSARARSNGTSPLDVKLTGQPYFLQAALDGVAHDVSSVHPKVVPFALIPFLWIVRSWRLSLVTLACICATAASSYFAMYLVSAHTQVANFAPSMMLSATIATSIDYSLFLLSRLREELAEGAATVSELEGALEVALHHAGHTVLVSGCTLALCFFGLMFFPISLVSTLGLATGVTIVISVIVNLTLLPALLLAFPEFFTRAGCCCRARHADADRPPLLPQPLTGTSAVQRVLLGADAGGEATAAGVPLSRKDADRRAAALSRRRRARRSCWSCLSGLSVRHGWLVVGAFVALTAPCAYEALSIRVSQSQQDVMPRTADASLAYTQIVAQFGSGALFPFQLLLLPADGAVESEAFFGRARTLVRRALELSNTTDSLSASGVMLSAGTDVPFELVARALHADAAGCAQLARLLRRPICELTRSAWAQFTNGDPREGRNATASYVSLAPAFDPFGEEGSAAIARLRAGLRAALAESGTNDTVALVGGAIAMGDSVQLVYAYFPMMVGVTLTVVFALLGLAFRSVVVPLRAVLTISVSLLLSMGAAWLVYGRGALDGLHWQPLGGQGSLAWTAPVLSFPIMVGLGLDYDIFLLGRILEYRLLGFTERDSIEAGVEHSGPLITAAGVIMAIAFGALLFSSSTSLNELAFLLTVSVLIDTLLVRTVLVPSAMAILNDRNWWPRRLPPPVPRVDLLPLRQPGGSFSEREERGGAPEIPPSYETVDSALEPSMTPAATARFIGQEDDMLGPDNEMRGDEEVGGPRGGAADANRDSDEETSASDGQ